MANNLTAIAKNRTTMTDHEWHKTMKAFFPHVKPIGLDPCLFAKTQTAHQEHKQSAPASDNTRKNNHG